MFDKTSYAKSFKALGQKYGRLNLHASRRFVWLALLGHAAVFAQQPSQPTPATTAPTAQVQCLQGESLQANGYCAISCRKDEKVLADGSCIYNPSQRTICFTGDTVQADGSCVHSDGSVSYQTQCRAGETASKTLLLCTYKPSASPLRAASGCLVGEQLLADGNCAATAESNPCQAGERLLEGKIGAVTQKYCTYAPSDAKTCRASDIGFDGKSGLCVYSPQLVNKGVMYKPYQARPN